MQGENQNRVKYIYSMLHSIPSNPDSQTPSMENISSLPFSSTPRLTLIPHFLTDSVSLGYYCHVCDERWGCGDWISKERCSPAHIPSFPTITTEVMKTVHIYCKWGPLHIVLLSLDFCLSVHCRLGRI